MGINNRDSTNKGSIDHKYGYFWLQSPIVISVLTSLWNQSIKTCVCKNDIRTELPTARSYTTITHHYRYTQKYGYARMHVVVCNVGRERGIV